MQRFRWTYDAAYEGSGNGGGFLVSYVTVIAYRRLGCRYGGVVATSSACRGYDYTGTTRVRLSGLRRHRMDRALESPAGGLFGAGGRSEPDRTSGHQMGRGAVSFELVTVPCRGNKTTGNQRAENC